LIVVYTPAGGEPEQYDASALRVSEASILQRTIDQKWAKIQEGLQEDDLDAMRGVVWVLKKRSNPSLRFGEIDPLVGEMTTRMDAREVESWVDHSFASADSDSDLTTEMVAAILLERLPGVAADPEHARRLVEARAKAPKADPAPDAEEPPATETDDPSPSLTSSEPATNTSDSSPTSSTSPLPESTDSPSGTSTP
jgi:hypothetical protein